ncbi:receptor-like protein kinase ANXUR2 [Abrus precatorius]|uniref:Receptor-like protein kinase ANXUR2 n=1 Tax=Abrus precatorius TaxID=3816 RepID=A0A8B8KZ97_ABRPR|nr:receptor-like protein kinase ANXUR2 [Abrus precatorius]
MVLKCLGFYRSKHANSSNRQYPTVIEELCHQFSLADLRKSTNNFDGNRLIGHGAFGKVYKGCLQHNEASDYTVALKRLYINCGQGCRVFKNEIELLCQLLHPNLVSLIGFCDHEDEKIIVYEYMSNGSLDEHLCDGNREPLSWKKRLEICIGAARGVHYLHTGAKRTIFHRDIKPSNILLDDEMKPRLSAFGVSIQGPHFMSKPKPIQVDSIAGANRYMAFEYALNGTITEKCDVYSFGMVLLDVVHGSENIRFWERTQPVEENIDATIEGEIAPECWEVFIDITQRCLQFEPDERPTMGEVEVQLELALSLQEQADIRNTNGDYTLFSTTIINLGVELESDTVDNIYSDTEDSDSEDTS